MILILTILPFLACLYGVVGGFLAAKKNITKIEDLLLWSFFWPLMWVISIGLFEVMFEVIFKYIKDKDS